MSVTLNYKCSYIYLLFLFFFLCFCVLFLSYSNRLLPTMVSFVRTLNISLLPKYSSIQIYNYFLQTRNLFSLYPFLHHMSNLHVKYLKKYECDKYYDTMYSKLLLERSTMKMGKMKKFEYSLKDL